MHGRFSWACVALVVIACTGERGGGTTGGPSDARGAAGGARGDAGGRTDAGPDACEVFDPAAVARAFETTIDPLSERATMGRTDSGTWRTSCGWDGPGDVPQRYSFHVRVDAYPSPDAAARAFVQARPSPALALADDVPGLADSATYTQDAEAPPARAALRWRAGAVVYELGVARPAGLDGEAARAALTELVAARF